MGKEMAKELTQLITKYFLPTCNNVVTRIFIILEFVLLHLFSNKMSSADSSKHPQSSTSLKKTCTDT